jgi:hypothetical protein
VESKMQTTDLKDLMETVDRIRSEMHPDLDIRFLEAVVRAEEENPEDDAAALRAIQVALRVTLVSKGTS